MSRPKKILLGIIIFAAVFTISVFVKNIHQLPMHSSVSNLDSYFDIQMDIHYRMYALIMDISKTHHNSPEDIKLFLNYIEKLHEEIIILGNNNRLAKITTHTEDTELLRWMSERLIWVMQPMDKVSGKDTKIAIFIMTSEIEYLHVSARFLVGDKMEEAMKRVDDFKKKFQK